MQSLKRKDKKNFEDELIEEWDKKKIIIGIIILILFLGGTVYLADAFGYNLSTKVISFFTTKPQVKGVQTENLKSFSIPIGDSIQKQVGSIQHQVTSLNVSEIATSSPQIQKIIHDIQGLQKYPENQAKQMCQQLCKGL